MNKPNVIIILMDTLRKDAFDKWIENYTGKYKNIIKNSFKFDNAIAPSSWTLPSHFSLFTGLYPSEHGVHKLYPTDRYMDLIERSNTYLGEFLMDFALENGYYTSGFIANAVVSYSGIASHFNSLIRPKFLSHSKFSPVVFLSQENFKKYSNLERGYKKAAFIIKNSPLKSSIFLSRFLVDISILKLIRNPTYKNYNELLSQFIQNIKFNSSQFIFFNFMEMHEPYLKFSDFSKFQFEQLFRYIDSNNRIREFKKIYFNQINKITTIFDTIISKLIEEKQLDNSIVIITSDHGQAFNEHGYLGHSIYNYDEISKIPLFIYAPKYLIDAKSYNKNINTNLVNLYDFIKEIIIDGKSSIGKLKSDIVLCETFGIVNNLSKYEKRDNFKEIIGKIDIPRKSLFKNDIKLTLNGDGKVEEFNGTEADYKELIEYLSIFNVDKYFKIPVDNVKI